MGRRDCRANLDGSSPQILVTGLGDARYIALDLANGKMYWTDAGYDHIRRANLNGTNAETLVTGQTGPFGIALDLAGGKMYWTDSSDQFVRRANLDGTGMETLVSGTAGTGIALDLINRKMYWDNIDPADSRQNPTRQPGWLGRGRCQSQTCLFLRNRTRYSDRHLQLQWLLPTGRQPPDPEYCQSRPSHPGEVQLKRGPRTGHLCRWVPQIPNNSLRLNESG